MAHVSVNFNNIKMFRMYCHDEEHEALYYVA